MKTRVETEDAEEAGACVVVGQQQPVPNAPVEGRVNITAIKTTETLQVCGIASQHWWETMEHDAGTKNTYTTTTNNNGIRMWRLKEERTPWQIAEKGTNGWN